jgi:uncharacterized YkwD family protein
MKKLKKILTIVALIAVVGTGIGVDQASAYTWSRSGSSNYTYSSGSTTNPDSYYRYGSSSGSGSTYQRSTAPTTTTTNSSVVAYGATGTKVAEIQGYLRQLGYTLQTENGRFGYYTLKAVISFQRANGLSATGKVDIATYNALKSAAGGSVTPAPTPAPTPQPAPTPAPTPAPKPAPAPAPVPAPTQGLTQDEQQMLNLVNTERAKNGLAPLQADMELVRLARMKSADMIAKNYFSHTSPTYGSPFDMMNSAGIAYRTAGENLAGAGSVTSAHTNLMNSSGHRANILNSAFTHIGIGIVDGGPYGKMFTQMFIGR